MAASYTYYGFDLKTGDVHGHLDLVGARPKWGINDPGDLGDPAAMLNGLSAIQREDIRGMTVPWRNGIAVDRDGTIIKAVCITTRRYESTSGAYRFGTTGILGYWRRRVIASNINWKNIDQFGMVRQLLILGGETIPLTMTYDTSGVSRDRTFAASDLKLVLDAILEVADNVDGFELDIDSGWDADTPGGRVKHYLRLGYPRLGRTGATADLMGVEWPINTVGGYAWDEDGSEFATHVWGSSQTDEGVTLVRTMSNPTLISQGYVRIDLPKTYSNISQVSTLDGHLLQALAEAGGLGNAPGFTVADEGDTAAGAWAVGDDVRLRITDPLRFPRTDGSPAPGLDMRLRLQEATLDPSVGRITMTMAPIIQAVT